MKGGSHSYLCTFRKHRKDMGALRTYDGTNFISSLRFFPYPVLPL